MFYAFGAIFHPRQYVVIISNKLRVNFLSKSFIEYASFSVLVPCILSSYPLGAEKKVQLAGSVNREFYLYKQRLQQYRKNFTRLSCFFVENWASLVKVKQLYTRQKQFFQMQHAQVELIIKRLTFKKIQLVRMKFIKMACKLQEISNCYECNSSLNGNSFPLLNKHCNWIVLLSIEISLRNKYTHIIVSDDSKLFRLIVRNIIKIPALKLNSIRSVMIEYDMTKANFISLKRCHARFSFHGYIFDSESPFSFHAGK